MAGFGVPVTLSRRPGEGPPSQLRPAQPAPAGGDGAVGLCEGGRGLRPPLRLLRHPVLPGPQRPARRRHPGRGGGLGAGAGGRAGRPGPGLVASTAATPDASRGRRRARPIVELVRAVAERVARMRLLYLYPSELTDGLIDAMVRHRAALLRPVAAARVAAPPAPHAAVGRRRPVPGAHRPHPGGPPRRRPALLLHRWLSGRDRGRPRPAAGVPRGGGARLGRASSPSPRGTRHLRRWGCRTPVPPASWPGAPARVRRAAGRHHRRRAGALGRSQVEVLVDEPGAGRSPPRGPRDRRRRPRAAAAGRWRRAPSNRHRAQPARSVGEAS